MVSPSDSVRSVSVTPYWMAAVAPRDVPFAATVIAAITSLALAACLFQGGLGIGAKLLDLGLVVVLLALGRSVLTRGRVLLLSLTLAANLVALVHLLNHLAGHVSERTCVFVWGAIGMAFSGVLAKLLLALPAAYHYPPKTIRTPPWAESGLMHDRAPRLPVVLAVGYVGVMLTMALLAGRAKDLGIGIPVIIAVILLVVFPLSCLGFLGVRRLRQRAAGTAAEVRRLDRRAPVLLLRSFSDDWTKVEDTAPWKMVLENLPVLWDPLGASRLSFEEVVANHVWRYGPVIAIGQPGQSLPPLGAAREYVSGEAWRERVTELVDEARLIVLVVGRTGGVAWEFREIASRGALGKLILLLPPGEPGALQGRWKGFCGEASSEAATVLSSIDPDTMLAAVPSAQGQAIVITGPKNMARDRTAYEQGLDLAVSLIAGTLDASPSSTA